MTSLCTLIGKRTRFLICNSILASCLSLGSTALGHETWLLPSHFRSQPGEAVRIDFTSGMRFPESDSAIKPERLQNARLRLGATWTESLEISADTKSLVIAAKPETNGVATIVVQLKPKEIDLSDELVVEYFEEIEASDEVRDAWAKMKGRLTWKEFYTKCAKTIVAVGDSEPDLSWREPTGLKFELIPLTNPFKFDEDSEIAVGLVHNGMPAIQKTIGILMEGHPKREFIKTDSQGVARFRLNKSGRILLFAVDLRLQSNETWESDFTTLTMLKP